MRDPDVIVVILSMNCLFEGVIELPFDILSVQEPALPKVIPSGVKAVVDLVDIRMKLVMRAVSGKVSFRSRALCNP